MTPLTQDAKNKENRFICIRFDRLPGRQFRFFERLLVASQLNRTHITYILLFIELVSWRTNTQNFSIVGRSLSCDGLYVCRASFAFELLRSFWTLIQIVDRWPESVSTESLFSFQSVDFCVLSRQLQISFLISRVSHGYRYSDEHIATYIRLNSNKCENESGENLRQGGKPISR